MTVAREDLGLEAAFWAQLPGLRALRPRQGPDHEPKLRRARPFINYPPSRTGNHWGDALPFSSRAPAAYYLLASCE